MRYSLLILALLLPLSASAQLTLGSPSSPTSASISEVHIGQIERLDHRNKRPRPLSGTDGSTISRLVAPDGAWIHSIWMKERNNRPCHVEIGWANVDDGQLTTGLSRYSQCVESNSSRIRTGFPYTATSPYGITGLKVCQRNSNDRVKGLRAIGRRLGFGGDFVTTGSSMTDADEQPNCNDWADEFRQCPSGQVVVGLRIEGQRARGMTSDVITGLAPICARVAIER